MIIGVKSQEPVRHVTCKLMGGGSWQPVCLKRSVSACLTPSLRAASVLQMQSAWLKSLQSLEDVSLVHGVAHFQAHAGKVMLAGFRKGNAGRLTRTHHIPGQLPQFCLCRWPSVDCLLAMLSSLQSNARQPNFAGNASQKNRNV